MTLFLGTIGAPEAFLIIAILSLCLLIPMTIIWIVNKQKRTNQSETNQTIAMENKLTNEQQTPVQTIIINHEKKESNGVGTAGFVLSLIALLVGIVPILGWIVWLLGAILSFAGLFKNPKGLAIAGFIISFIGIILLIFVFAGLAAVISAF